jgi:hypothetical protein
LTAQELTQPYATDALAGDAGGRLRDDVYRDVNDRIREVCRAFGSRGPMQLFCECSRPSCLTPILLEPELYDAVRASEEGSIVVPAHASPSADIVARSQAYWVVKERS